MKDNSWYVFDNVESLDSPALVFYKDRILANIRNAVSMVRHPSLLRPHVKTNKSADICALMMQAGITKFKCATIAEAEMLGSIGAPDVLFAFQPAGPKIGRLLALTEKFPSTSFSCVVDNLASVKEIGALFHAAGKRIGLFIDLNIGQNRTGITPARAFPLFESTAAVAGVSIVGLHAYDGHLTDPDTAAIKKQCQAAFEPVVQLQKKIADASGTTLTIVAGGSPTFPVHAEKGSVECSPGTFALWDWSYKTNYPSQPFEVAALLVTRIVSIVDTERMCLDLGHKSVAPEGAIPRVHFLNAPEAIQTGHSEEHMVVKVPDTAKYHVGELFYAVPNHICPSVSMYERGVVVEQNRIVGEWKITARDKKITV